MNPARAIVLAVAVVATIVLVASSAYVIPEGRQVIITQFGEPKDQVTDAGLHFKKPFFQEARYVDKRILTWDGDPNQIPTKDKKYIFVDTTARWRITDPLKFIQTVQNERGAKNRLDGILDGATRNAISNHNLVEAVRNSNSIVDKLAEKNETIRKKVEAGEKLDDEDEVMGEIGLIGVGREQLSQMIVQEADEKLKQFGIQLIDVQLRRIAYEESVEAKVYERMVSERNRIAQKIRSVGKGEMAKIQGKTSRDLQSIESEAYRKSQQIKGKAEAEATKIYARAFSADPRFFEFMRTMEAYKKSLKENSEYILSSDSEFLKMLKSQ